MKQEGENCGILDANTNLQSYPVLDKPYIHQKEEEEEREGGKGRQREREKGEEQKTLNKLFLWCDLSPEQEYFQFKLRDPSSPLVPCLGDNTFLHPLHILFTSTVHSFPYNPQNKSFWMCNLHLQHITEYNTQNTLQTYSE